jgi:hypothetical protein
MTKGEDRFGLLPGEPATSYAGWILYREMRPGERSLRAVADRLGRAPSLIDRYSSRWRWVERTREWDANEAGLRAEDARQAEREWVRRHSDTGKQLQALGLAGLGHLLQRDPSGRPVGLRDSKPADLVRMVIGGAQLELTAATHAATTVEEAFVERVVEVMTAVFMEANKHADEQTRAEAFRAGCVRALDDLAR